MKKKFVIRDNVIRRYVVDFISELPLEPDIPEVVIRPYRKDRSLEQNDRLWALHTAAATEFGSDPETLHYFCCARFLGRHHILDPTSGEVALIPNTTTRFWDIDLNEHRRLTVSEFATFMTQVEELYIDQWVNLDTIYDGEKEEEKTETG